MTARAENFASTSINRETALMTDGGRMVARASQRIAGTAFVLASLGVWLAPGSNWDSDLMLFKLMLSVSALMAGTGLIMASSTPRSPEVEFDMVREEVRLVRNSGLPAQRVLQSCAFSDLSLVERRGPHVRLWDDNNELLAEVTFDGNTALGEVMGALRRSGKVV